MDDILQPHREATVSRCRLEPVVLALQDTTTLNCNGYRRTTGLVDIGGGGSGTRGIRAQVGLAVGEGRRPLGVFELNASQRDGGDGESESVRWLCGGRLPVRSDRSRRHRVVAAGGTPELRDFMATQPVPGTRKIAIRPCGGPRRRQGRKARLELRAAAVELAPPSDRIELAPLLVLAVPARESAPPKGRDPPHWLLIATEGGADPANARRVVSWHEAR